MSYSSRKVPYLRSHRNVPHNSRKVIDSSCENQSETVRYYTEVLRYNEAAVRYLTAGVKCHEAAVRYHEASGKYHNAAVLGPTQQS